MLGENVYFFKLYQTADRLLIIVLTALLAMSLVLAPRYHTGTEALTIGIPTWAVCAWLVRAYGGTLVTRCAIGAAATGPIPNSSVDVATPAAIEAALATRFRFIRMVRSPAD